MKIATVAIITGRRLPFFKKKVLLGRKQGTPEIGAGTLNGPGGKLEPFDGTPFNCVMRETWEELGIILCPATTKRCAIITFYQAGEPDFEVHFYRASRFKGRPHETRSMVPEWHDVNKVPFGRMLEADEYLFPKLLRGETFNANVYYRERAKGLLDIKFFPFSDHS